MNRRFLIFFVSLATSCCAEASVPVPTNTIDNAQPTSVVPQVTDVKASAAAPIVDAETDKQQAINVQVNDNEMACVSVTGPFYYVEYCTIRPLPDAEKDRALIEEASRGNVNIVRALLDQDARVTATYGKEDKYNGIQKEDTALLAAISCFDWENFGFRGDVNYVVSYDRVVKMLIDAGSDVNAKAAEGETPLILASNFGLAEAVKNLLAAGAKINEQDEKGDSALHAAARVGRDDGQIGTLYTQALIEIIQDLLKAGADKALRNKAGKTAYEVAVEYNNLDLAGLLK